MITSKEELKKYMYDLQYYDEVMTEIKELQNKLLTLTNKANTYKGLDTSHPREIDGIRKQIKEKEKSLVKIEKFKSVVEEAINSLEQPYKNVLYFRYVKQYKFNKIAIKMGYSLQRVFQLNRTAIEKYAQARHIKDSK